jgi:hypothetical protein
VVLSGTDPARVAESIFKLATVDSGQFYAAIKRL